MSSHSLPVPPVATLRTTVQSFDLFDTLIARACVTPGNLLAQVETAVGITGFAASRTAAEHRVYCAGQPFEISDIYEELCNSGCTRSGVRVQPKPGGVVARPQSSVVLTPSKPLLLLPQAHTLPSARAMKEVLAPAASFSVAACVAVLGVLPLPRHMRPAAGRSQGSPM